MPACPDECTTHVGGINDRGDVGTTSEHSQQERAVLWPRSGGRVELGLGVAWDIVNNSTIVGASNAQPTVWTSGGPALSSPIVHESGAAFAANNSWLVVGIGGNRDRSFIWHIASNTLLFLAQSRADAADINERGDVVDDDRSRHVGAESCHLARPLATTDSGRAQDTHHTSGVVAATL